MASDTRQTERFAFTLNGREVTFEGDPNMPLLWVLRDALGLTGTKFGCGMAMCGACTVHVDGAATRSCVLPVDAVRGTSVTTIEGVGNTAAGRAVQDAWVDLNVVQCGYCQSGQIMSASARCYRTTARQPMPISMPR